MGEGLRDCPKGSMHAIEKVRVLQRKLYRAAKAQPERTFGVLYEKVYSKEVLSYAWEQVRRNRGSAGIDNETIEDVEAYGVDRLLEELHEELRARRYRPRPVLRVFTPKPDGRQRPLGIPRVRDRIVQAAVRAVIEPLFEASFRPGSFGFRPKRGARQAIEEIRKWVNFGYDEVIDLDLKSFFDTIDHELLVKLVMRRVRDPPHPPADPALAACRGDARRGLGRERGRHAARRRDLAAFVQHLPSSSGSLLGAADGGRQDGPLRR